MQLKPFLTNTREPTKFGFENITSLLFICSQGCSPSRAHAIPPFLKRAMREADSRV